jgi:acyl-CoA hydrolase
LRSADYTNNTHLIRQFDHIVAVNSAIQVDLTGQVCAESIGARIYSGVGGQMDFMRGAALAARGRPIIALPATAPARVHQAPGSALDEMVAPVDGRVSRITPVLAPGAGVTTSRAHVHYVVTEYGVASLHGRDLAERARALIALAAPQFREGLERAAHALRLLV